MAWWQANVGTSHRTWVRIPGPPCYLLYFFFRLFHAKPGVWFTMHPHEISGQMAPKPNLMAHMRCLSYAKVNVSHGIAKVSQACIQIGLENC